MTANSLTLTGSGAALVLQLVAADIISVDEARAFFIPLLERIKLAGAKND